MKTNTIPCVYMVTMNTCQYGANCIHSHYANQLTNIKYCNGCIDVVVDKNNHYKNKKRGRVCLFKHEKETFTNYVTRMKMLRSSSKV